jgi:KaiC/GvpD/RAD55 family RecA-like ATPase
MKSNSKVHAVSDFSDSYDSSLAFDDVRIVSSFARFCIRKILESDNRPPASINPDELQTDFLDYYASSSETKSYGHFEKRDNLRDRVVRLVAESLNANVFPGESYMRKREDRDSSEIPIPTDTQYVVSRTVESPLGFCLALLSSSIRKNDIQYFYFRSLCERHNLTYGDSLGAAFYRLASRLNSLSTSSCLTKERPNTFCDGYSYQDLLEFLKPVAKAEMTKAFIECGLSTHLFEVFYSKSAGKTFLRTRGRADSEFLFGAMFAIPTASKGLNELFGGSGPLMTIGKNPNGALGMPGRVLLVSGRFGSGKTVLALLMACEVAKKGGISWYFSTEQTVAEVLFTLRTITGEPSDHLRVITDSDLAMTYVDRERGANEGVLIVLNMTGVTEEELWSGLTVASGLGNHLAEPSCLRLMVVDSLNAVATSGATPAKGNIDRKKQTTATKLVNEVVGHPELVIGSKPIDEALASEPIETDNHKTKSLRQSLFFGIDRCTQSGTNLLLLEEQNDSSAESNFCDIRNLADCVIRLSVDSPSLASSHGYARRNIEILKSRFQRDQRGKHIFSITPPNGIHVVPSVASVKARVGARRLETGSRRGKFGLENLDKILKVESPAAGEVNVVRGDPGTFKSAISTAFLNGVVAEFGESSDRSKPVTGLFVSMRMGERRFLKALSTVADLTKQSLPDHLRVCQLPNAFVTSGEIMRLIEEQFKKAISEGRPVRRVVLDDVGEWANFSPFIRDDSSFGPALLDFFARHSLLLMATVNTTIHSGDHHLHHFIIENATRLIQLSRIVHGGRQRSLLRVIETPQMNHMRDSFELRLDSRDNLHIDTLPSLFEISDDGQFSVAGVELYLQSESQQQEKYNERIEQQLRATLTSEVHMEVPESISGTRDLSRLGLSVVNRLQVMQVDGYRLGPAAGDDSLPTLFDLNAFRVFGENTFRNCDRYLERLRDRTEDQLGRVIAVPYYDNLSFLVGSCTPSHESDGVTHAFDFKDLTWESIADLSDEHLQSQASDADQTTCHPFFDFPQSCDENLNCLFFEILFYLSKNKDAGFSGLHLNFDDLTEILLSDVGKEATALFHRVASPAFAFHSAIDSVLESKPIIIRNHKAIAPQRYYVSSKARVWRHWFTTYNQMMSCGGIGDNGRFTAINHGKDQTIRLRALPGKWTTAGEWYLCVPEHSAVPGAGLSIIDLLQNESADRERYDLGVGLPVRRVSYEGQMEECTYPDSPTASQLTLDFFHTLQDDPKIRRDRMPGYCTLSPFLANWLRRLLHTSEFCHDVESNRTLHNVLHRMLKRTADIVSNSLHS